MDQIAIGKFIAKKRKLHSQKAETTEFNAGTTCCTIRRFKQNDFKMGNGKVYAGLLNY